MSRTRRSTKLNPGAQVPDGTRSLRGYGAEYWTPRYKKMREPGAITKAHTHRAERRRARAAVRGERAES